MPNHAGRRTEEVLDFVYAALFDGIVHGRYEPGMWLRENNLAEQFGCSRSPIRKVLQQLDQDRLIELVPKRGARVIGFTADDVEDVYDIRKALEPLALRLGFQNLSIQVLFEINQRLKDLEVSDDASEHARVDSELHDYLLRSSGRAKLVSMVNELYRMLANLRELNLQNEEVRRVTIEEHSQIVYALVVRDISKANEALVHHIENSKVRVLTRVLRDRPVQGSSAIHGVADP